MAMYYAVQMQGDKPVLMSQFNDYKSCEDAVRTANRNYKMLGVDFEPLKICAIMDVKPLKPGPKAKYTRYADDMCISCRVDFPYKVIENYIIDTLRWMHAPFQLNTQKTHYGSRSGQNWILGVMLNKDNEISIGHREKKYFESMLTSYILSHGQGTFSGSYSRDAARPWPLEDVRKLHGAETYLQSELEVKTT